MRDSDIRHSLHNEFLAYFKQDGISIVVDELKVCNGQSIADVAVINGALHAFEIKSDSDTLMRLPKQVENYNKVFDYATIVVNGKYLNRVAPLIPEWWGIWLICINNSMVEKKVIRQGQRNPTLDPFSIAQLLWREEALHLLTTLNLDKGYRTKRKWLLWERIAENVPLQDLCENVRFYLKNRVDWKISSFIED